MISSLAPRSDFYPDQVQTFKSIDLNYTVTALIEENVLQINIKSRHNYNHCGLEFTKGFARELRDWLNQALPAHED